MPVRFAALMVTDRKTLIAISAQMQTIEISIK